MSKKTELADLRVYLDHEGSLYRAVSLSARQTSHTRKGEYEVYVENFHNIMRGKDSVHSSGRIISRTTTVNRSAYEWTVRVAAIQKMTRIAGVTFGRARGRSSNVPSFPRSGPSGKKGDRRVTTTIPMPTFAHGYEVFAIPGDVGSIVPRLLSTPPYPQSEVVDVLVADWISPVLALVIWNARGDDVYRVSEASRTDTRSRLFLVRPAAYMGTWVQAEIGSPNEDALVHGFPHTEWAFEQAIDPGEFYFARDGRGEMDRVVATSTIPQEEAEALLARAAPEEIN